MPFGGTSSSTTSRSAVSPHTRPVLKQGPPLLPGTILLLSPRGSPRKRSKTPSTPSLSGPPSILSKLAIFSLTTILCYLIWVPLTFPRTSPSRASASKLWFPPCSGRGGPVGTLWCVASALSRRGWRFNFSHVSGAPAPPFSLSVRTCPYMSWRTPSSTLTHFPSTSPSVCVCPHLYLLYFISMGKRPSPMAKKKSLRLHPSSHAHLQTKTLLSREYQAPPTF